MKFIDKKISSEIFNLLEERDFCSSDLIGAFIQSMEKFKIDDYQRFYFIDGKKYKVSIQKGE